MNDTEGTDWPRLTPEDARFISQWENERSDDGRPLRPWARNYGTVREPDPDYGHALAETEAVFRSPRFTHLTTEEKMAEVDKRMGVARPGGRQSVMGGGLTGARKSKTIALSPEIERLAIRTKFGGPNAKDDAEHIEAYRKQIEKSRQTKGARP